MPFLSENGFSASSDPVLDFSGNFVSSSPSGNYRRRVLTPYSNSNVNYTIVAPPADIKSVRWVASRDTWFSGSNEATIDSLVIRTGESEEVGARGGGIEGSERQWLSRGEDDFTGNHFITIHIQSWLQRMGRTDDSGNGGSYSPQPGDFMKLKIEWTRREDGFSRKGVSSSGLFTVAESADTAAVKQKWNQDVLRNFDEGQLNGFEEATATATATETDVPSSSGVATSPGFSSASPPRPPSISAEPFQEGYSQEGDSSISPGAVAGIAAGSGIALILLITALVWYIITRRHGRHHSRHHQHPVQRVFDARVKTAVPTDDKRNSTTAHAAHSPQSPDSEENLVRGGRRSRRHTQIHTDADDADDSTDGPIMRHRQEEHEAPPREVAAAANFAERGMTVEERRWWEEEERQLDDEIARKNEV
ncbi:hypothetical protein E4U21_000343 [Claviceps maximensis]|nr:hypothetical protein E4U21_000343 [Claviceps maximensis]